MKNIIYTETVSITFALLLFLPAALLAQTNSFPITHNLSKGWTGPEVIALQSILDDLGFLAGHATGYFGSLTESAVEAFQQQNNLAAVGIVGPKTRASLAAVATTRKPSATLSQSTARTTSDSTTGQTFTVSWSSKNATSCTLQKTAPNGVTTNPWATGTSGSKQASPFLIGIHHWWIDCTGAGGTVHKDLYHTVATTTVISTATITADSDQTSAGQTFTVNWNSSNATSCNIVKSTPGLVDNTAWCTAGQNNCSTSGSQTASPYVLGTHTYTLTCTGAGGTVTQSISHTVSSATTATTTAPTAAITPTVVTSTYIKQHDLLLVNTTPGPGNPSAGNSIYTVHSDGTGKTILTTDGVSPDWTPDGKIIFASNRSGSQQVWIMDADGSNARQIGNLSPSMLPVMPQMGKNGLIVFMGAGANDTNTGIWTMQSDGSGLTQLTSGMQPSLAPSGTWIAYTLQTDTPYHREIWRINTDGTGKKQLTFLGDVLNYPDANAPSISPDEQTVSFFTGTENARQVPGATGQSIFTWGYKNVGIIPATGGARTIITPCQPVTTQAQFDAATIASGNCIAADNPGWSPDGKWLIFDTGFSDGGPTWLVDINGQNFQTFYPTSRGTVRVALKSDTTVSTIVAAPTATISASSPQTSAGQTFTVSWDSTGATSCTIQKSTPAGTITNPWATGTAGSQSASPYLIGRHHWWIDCTGPGGTAHADLYHTVNSSASPSSTAFSVGNRIVTTDALYVRATPSTSGTILGGQQRGSLGTIIGGPTVASGYIWWQINYDSAPSGWSAGNFLQTASDFSGGDGGGGGGGGDAVPTPSTSDLPSKIALIQQNLPTWMGTHPDLQSEAMSLLQTLTSYMQAGDVTNAGSIADKILNLMGL